MGAQDKRRAPIPTLAATAQVLCPQASPVSHYELMTALFDDWILPRLSVDDMGVCTIYFGLSAEYRTKKSSERRRKVAEEVLFQSWTNFRDPVI